MKKAFLSILLVAAILLAACAPAADPDPTSDVSTTEYMPLTAIDHSVVAPDVRAAMSENEAALYRSLTEAALARKDSVSLSGSKAQLSYLVDIFRRDPYFFLVKSAKVTEGRIDFTYAYDAAEHQEILAFMDDAFLQIACNEAEPEDNELDTILKIYSAVTHRIHYDTKRQDNKQLSSPLFTYPRDEIYKALRDDKSLCFGFAYVMCYALLQRGIDCFTVYGLSRNNDMGHMWDVFRYDGAFFTCDPSWDRAEEGYSKLYHFGKTDDERFADALEARDFAEYHDSAYGEVSCTDDRFSIFRNVIRFSYVSDHDYYIERKNFSDNIFNTADFSLK